jgi:hypothetical protein
VPPRIATLVKAQAGERRLSTARFLTKPIEREIEREEGGMAYSLEDLRRIMEATDAECRSGKRTVYGKSLSKALVPNAIEKA